MSWMDEYDDAPSTSLMQQVTEQANTLARLWHDVETATEALNTCQKRYDEYRFVTLPQSLKLAGVRSLETEDGHKVSLVKKYHCSPNKNEADRALIAQWLTDNKAEHLVRSSLTVPIEYAPMIPEEVPVKKVTDINTNSLKAWIKDQLGVNGGLIHLTAEDVPKCIHFIEMEECEIE